MKRFYFLIVSVFIYSSLFAEDNAQMITLKNRLLGTPVVLKSQNTSGEISFLFFNGLVLNENIYFYADPIQIITKKNITLDSSKFYLMKRLESIFILITGGDLIFTESYPYDDGDMWKDVGFPPKKPEAQEFTYSNVFYLWEDGIQSIKASSVLREKTKSGQEILYDESQLRQTFYGVHESTVNMNTYKRAWAEGVPGPGIGEKLSIVFTFPTDHMMVLNGYVNLKRMDLYTANNRVKTAVIESKDPQFRIEYTFDDVVCFSEISFPERTREVTFTIQDVYKGTKYDDTCITAIYVKQQPWFKTHEAYQIVAQGSKEYEDTVDRIEQELRSKGYIK